MKINRSQKGALGFFLITWAILNIVLNAIFYDDLTRNGFLGFMLLVLFVGIYLSITSWSSKQSGKEPRPKDELNKKLEDLFSSFNKDSNSEDEELSEEFLSDMRDNNGDNLNN